MSSPINFTREDIDGEIEPMRPMNDVEAMVLAANCAAIAHPVFVQQGWTYHDTHPQPPRVEKLAEMIYQGLRESISDPEADRWFGRMFIHMDYNGALHVYLSLGSSCDVILEDEDA